jgi:cysteine desulfurase/selenocysteine lyase
MLESFGLDGAVRVSSLHSNSAANINRFLQITQEIADAFAFSPEQSGTAEGV